MDAKVGNWVVTPRIGKPVEIQALWLNALQFGAELSNKWQEPFFRGLESFQSRFWYEEGGYLYDVLDVDHRAGTADATLRPNQIFAAGGLPTVLLDEDKARSVVEVVEKHLLTPAGLRSLAPNEPGYCPHYVGGVYERDRAYHQGTVWPWLMGPFVEAWVRSQGSTARAKSLARKRFLEPFCRQLDPLKLGHLPEIADGDDPHQRRGCPFQAWSVGEALRMELQVLVTSKSTTGKRRVQKTSRKK
jgi:glycogen debranching enzyme